MRQIILASTSPRRKMLMGFTGLPFTVVASDYEEDMTLKMPPHDLVKTLSHGKAAAVAKKYKNAIVIGADTIVVLGKHVMGKPHTAPKAIAMLKKLNGKVNTVLTGVTVIDTVSGKMISQTVETKIHFRKVSLQEILVYVKTSEPLDKAGAYAIQERGIALIHKIDGDYASALGLPLHTLRTILKKFSVKML